MDNGLKLVVSAVGSRAELARRLGISKQAAYAWSRIPHSRLEDVSRVTGIPTAQLRPDLFQLFKPKRTRGPRPAARASRCSV
jgi:hypothetical protein